MKSSSTLKNEALAELNGKWGMYIVLTIIFYIIYSVPSIYNFNLSSDYSSNNIIFSILTIHLILELFTLPMVWGYNVTFLKRSREGLSPKITDLFEGYKDFKRIFSTMFLFYLYSFLWSLLFIIPGIIKSLSYAMTPYILLDNPNISGDQAIEKSMKMMDGHKADLFVLYLSFIGWAILSVLTCNIGFIFLVPYMLMSTAMFYKNIKELQDNSFTDFDDFSFKENKTDDFGFSSKAADNDYDIFGNKENKGNKDEGTYNKSY